MKESDLMWSRRRFLLTSVKATAAVGAALTLGPEVFEFLDRMGPRRLLVGGISGTATTYNEILPKILAQGLRALRQNALMPQLVNDKFILAYPVPASAPVWQAA